MLRIGGLALAVDLLLGGVASAQVSIIMPNGATGAAGPTGPTGPTGGGTPGGSTTQFQYNNGGAFSGSAELTRTPTTGATLTNAIVISDGTPDLAVALGGGDIPFLLSSADPGGVGSTLGLLSNVVAGQAGIKAIGYNGTLAAPTKIL